MRCILLFAFTVFLLAGCEKTPKTEDEITHSEKMADQMSSFLGVPNSAESSTSDSDPNTPTPEQVEWLASIRMGEAKAIAKSSGWAKRDGDQLTILTQSSPIARFSDKNLGECEGFDTCSLWWFSGLVKLRDANGDEQAYPVILHDNGEITEAVVVDGVGRLVWLQAGVSVSPSGRWIASSSDSMLTDGFLTLTDWWSPGHETVLRFSGAACMPDAWKGEVLKVICGAEGLPEKFVAQVSKDSTGNWKMTSATKRSALPIDGIMDPGLTAQQRVGNEAYERNSGFERLKD